MEAHRQQRLRSPVQRGHTNGAYRRVLDTVLLLLALAAGSPADSILGSGNLSGALPLYIADALENPRNWWPAYRAAWILNRLDMPDSARVWAERAHNLRPVSRQVLGELLRALSVSPERVLEYGPLVSGGGVCRFRLAQAEHRLESPGEHTGYLEEVLAFGSDSARADAACWLSVLYPDRSLDLLALAVELAPREEFYRTMYAGRLAEEGFPSMGLQVLAPVEPGGYYYWQALAGCLEAAGELEAAGNAYRSAFAYRSCPSSAADLGWFLYRTGRDLVRAGDLPAGLPLLQEASRVWHPESSWARTADSLHAVTARFLRLATGWESLD